MYSIIFLLSILYQFYQCDLVQVWGVVYDFCHDDCTYGDGQTKKQCSAMQNGFCTVCPQKCSFLAHTNCHYIRRRRAVTKWQTNAALKAKYQKSTQGFTTTEKAIADNIQQLDNVSRKTNQAYRTMFSLNKELDEISMSNKKSESLVEYLAIQIKDQNKCKSSGYEDRVKGLQMAKKEAQINVKHIQGVSTMSKQELYKQLREKRINEMLKKASPTLYQRFKKIIGF